MSLLTKMFVSSPHGKLGFTTNQMMRIVAYATLPGLAAQIYFFGWGSLIQAILCISTALVAEAVVLSLREKPVRRTLSDGSAMLTGLLLALSIPPLAPWWIAVIGTVFAIIVVKQLYGGMGFNLFNPAMAGYVVLLISFPVAMTNWLPPTELLQHPMAFGDAFLAVFTGFTYDGYNLTQLKMSVDGITMATPLDHFKTEQILNYTTTEILSSPLYGEYGGTGWLEVNLAFLLGGLALLKLGVIRWHIPVAVIGSLALCALVGITISPDQTYPMSHSLLSGATMFAAFFIATDPVSASTTNQGRLIYGCFIGVMIYIIRIWGGYPDGIAFAVLLANMCVPLIDHYTKPVTYGHKRRREAKS